MNTSAGNSGVPARRAHLSVDDLIRAKQARPVRSLADLDAMAADIFESDDEFDDFLQFTHAERHRDMA
ncbi:hypothetical protein ACQPZJ_42655 [Actinoplanes sp. CA-054009]